MRACKRRGARAAERSAGTAAGGCARSGVCAAANGSAPPPCDGGGGGGGGSATCAAPGAACWCRSTGALKPVQRRECACVRSFACLIRRSASGKQTRSSTPVCQVVVCVLRSAPAQQHQRWAPARPPRSAARPPGAGAARPPRPPPPARAPPPPRPPRAAPHCRRPAGGAPPRPPPRPSSAGTGRARFQGGGLALGRPPRPLACTQPPQAVQLLWSDSGWRVRLQGGLATDMRPTRGTNQVACAAATCAEQAFRTSA